MGKMPGDLRIILLFVILLMAWCTPPSSLFGQEQADISYVLGPDDVVSISVWRHPELSTGSAGTGAGILVPPDGTISFPFLGTINVKGMTVEELRLKIQDSLKDIYRNPMVTVGLIKRRPFRLYILGAVQKAGMFDMPKPEITIAEALALADGVRDKAAVNRVTVQRGTEVIPVDLSGLIYRGEEGPSLMIKSEDRIIVPEQRNKIALLGEVKSPGVFDIRDDQTLLDALAMGGGFNDRAKPNKVYLYRRINGKYEVQKINTREIFDKPDPEKNITLQNGDIVFVHQLNAPNIDKIASIMSVFYWFQWFFPITTKTSTVTVPSR